MARDISGEKNPNYKGHMHRKCAQCAGSIGGSSEKRKYCSRECLAAACRSSEGHKNCPWCGKDFYHRLNEHCSATCARERRASRAANPGQKARAAERKADGLFTGLLGRPPALRQPRVCPTCKKGFLALASRTKRQYCSRECYGKEVGRRQAGENHPGYKHGLSSEKTSERQRLRKHPGYVAWRDAVFARDRHTCRACLGKGDLCAHHHVAWANNPKLRLKVSNGITLCTECHRLWHAYNRKGVFVGKESLLQSKVKAALEEYGFWVYNVPGNPLGVSGVPDLLLCFRGLLGGVECKVFPNYLSEPQRHVGEQIKAAGGIFFVVSSEDDVGKVIELFETKRTAGAWADQLRELVLARVESNVLDKERG